MKIDEIIFFVFVLFIGILIGLWGGVEYVYVEVETIPTKTMFEVISLIATVLACVSTILGLWLAVHVYRTWARQQVAQEIIKVKFDLIREITELDTSFAKLLLTSTPESLKALISELQLSRIKVFNLIRHYYTIDKNSRNGKTVLNCKANYQGDYLDLAKRLCFFALEVHKLYGKSHMLLNNGFVTVDLDKPHNIEFENLWKKASPTESKCRVIRFYSVISDLTQKTMDEVSESI